MLSNEEIKQERKNLQGNLPSKGVYIIENSIESKNTYSLDGIFVILSMIQIVIVLQVKTVSPDYSYFETVEGLLVSFDDHIFKLIDKQSVEAIFEYQRKKSGILSLHEVSKRPS